MTTMNLSKGFAVCLLALLALVLCSCSPMVTSGTAMRSQWHQTTQNVKELGKALVSYQMANGGRLPDTLEELAESHPDIRKLQDRTGWPPDKNDVTDILAPIDLRAYPYHTNIVLVYKRRERTLQQPRYYYDPKGIEIYDGRRFPLVVPSPVLPGALEVLEFGTERTLVPHPQDARRMIVGPRVTNVVSYGILPPHKK